MLMSRTECPFSLPSDVGRQHKFAESDLVHRRSLTGINALWTELFQTHAQYNPKSSPAIRLPYTAPARPAK